MRYTDGVAGAMNRVLEAEGSAQTAIADCEQQTQKSLERARQQCRTILERAHGRIMTLHAQALRTLERRIVQVRERSGAAPDPIVAEAADRARLQAAIESLVERLTRDTEDEL